MEGKLGDEAGNVGRKKAEAPICHSSMYQRFRIYLPSNKRLVKVLHEQGIWIRVCVCVYVHVSVCVRETEREREGDPI